MNADDYMAERERALKYIKSLNQVRFAEFFYDAVRHWHQSEISKDGSTQGEGLVLARCDYNAKLGRDGLLVDLIALPTTQAYETGNAGEYTQFIESGDCERCGASVTSVHNKAICPVCGAEVGLT